MKKPCSSELTNLQYYWIMFGPLFEEDSSSPLNLYYAKSNVWYSDFQKCFAVGKTLWCQMPKPDRFVLAFRMYPCEGLGLPKLESRAVGRLYVAPVEALYRWWFLHMSDGGVVVVAFCCSAPFTEFKKCLDDARSQRCMSSSQYGSFLFEVLHNDEWIRQQRGQLFGFSDEDIGEGYDFIG